MCATKTPPLKNRFTPNIETKTQKTNSLQHTDNLQPNNKVKNLQKYRFLKQFFKKLHDNRIQSKVT